MDLIPDNLSVFAFWLLVGTSFFGSFLSTAAGIGGGVTMLAVMAQVMPPLALIPVHGVVQLGSNISRMAVMFKHIDWWFLGWFLAGGLLGALVGSQIVTALPVAVLQLILGAFILYSIWGRMPTVPKATPFILGVGGGATTLASMFVGASGPFAMTIVKSFGYDRFQKVGTFSGVMVIQHGLKIIVFTVLGFAFAAYLPLMASMIFAGFIGTLVGRRFLERVSEAFFKKALDLVLTLLALRLLWQAVEAW